MSDTGFLDDFREISKFAADIGRHPRTVNRWMRQADGLPYTCLGNRTFVHIPTAREWLLSRMRRPNPRRTNKDAA